MFSRVGNPRRTCDLNQALFSIFFNDISLEDLYGKFCGICEEIDFNDITVYVAAMKRHL